MHYPQTCVEALKDLADEERVYAGEFLRLLRELAQVDELFLSLGVKDLIKESSRNANDSK